jgi:peptidoglycan hydrolase CwlO-like protein
LTTKYVSGVLAFLILLLFGLSAVSAALPAPETAPLPAPVTEKERLIAEILALDTKLALLNRQKAEAEARIEAIKANLTSTAQEKEQLARRAAEEQEYVAAWLRFLAEDGSLTYLDVLLGALDLSDFLTRLDLVLTIIESNVNKLEKLQALAAAIAAKEAELARQQAELAKAHAAISESLAAAQSLRQAKARALAEAEKKLADFATVLAVSQAWETVLPDIDRLLARLEAVPWENVQPDSLEVNFLLGRANLVYRETTLAGLLRNTEEQGDGVDLSCLPGRLILERPAATGRPSYALSLELVPDGRRLILKPAGIAVAGVVVPAPTLALIFAGHELVLTLPLPAGLKIAQADVEVGELRLTLIRE